MKVRILALIILLLATFTLLNNNGIGNSQVGACGKCGDGVCVKQCGETAKSCPADCGGTVE